MLPNVYGGVITLQLIALFRLGKNLLSKKQCTEASALGANLFNDLKT